MIRFSSQIPLLKALLQGAKTIRVQRQEIDMMLLQRRGFFGVQGSFGVTSPSNTSILVMPNVIMAKLD